MYELSNILYGASARILLSTRLCLLSPVIRACFRSRASACDWAATWPSLFLKLSRHHAPVATAHQHQPWNKHHTARHAAPLQPHSFTVAQASAVILGPP